MVKLFIRSQEFAHSAVTEAEVMGVERKRGRLESFSLEKGVAHAYIRIGGELIHAPMINRGVLADTDIRLCVNGERYLPLVEGSDVEADVNVDSKGEKPFIVAWAPK